MHKLSRVRNLVDLREDRICAPYARGERLRRHRCHVGRGAGPVPRDVWTVDLDRRAVAQNELRPASLLTEHFQQRRRAEAAEPVDRTSGRGAEVADTTDACLAVDLDQNLAAQRDEDLLATMTVERSDLVGRNGLDADDEPTQTMLESGDDAWI